MYSIKQLALVYFLCFFLLSCDSNQETTQKVDISLVSKAEIRIPLDSLTSIPYFNTQLFQENTLVLLNSNINALQFYEFKNKGKLLKRVKLDTEGENGMGLISQFLVHTSDSIFLLNASQYRLYLINGKGDIITKYSLLNRKIGDGTAMPMVFPFHGRGMVFHKGKIYLSSRPDLNTSLLSAYQDNYSTIELDLVTKKFSYIYGFSEIYKKNLYPVNKTFHSFIYSSSLDKFIYSYQVDDNIQVTDYQNTEQYHAASPEIGTIQPLPKPILSDIENNEEGNKRASYLGLFFNPYQKTYLRTAVPASFEANGERRDVEFIFIYLDEHLKKLGEWKLPQIYVPFFIHFTKKGMHLLKLSGNENEMVYECFEVMVK